jgi:hypothetical protein
MYIIPISVWQAKNVSRDTRGFSAEGIQKGRRRDALSVPVGQAFLIGSLMRAGIASRIRVRAFWIFSMELE